MSLTIYFPLAEGQKEESSVYRYIYDMSKQSAEVYKSFFMGEGFRV